MRREPCTLPWGRPLLRYAPPPTIATPMPSGGRRQIEQIGGEWVDGGPFGGNRFLAMEIWERPLQQGRSRSLSRTSRFGRRPCYPCCRRDSPSENLLPEWRSRAARLGLVTIMFVSSCVARRVEGCRELSLAIYRGLHRFSTSINDVVLRSAHHTKIIYRPYRT